MLDKVTQPFGGIRCQVIDVIEFVFREETLDQIAIQYRSLNKFRPFENAVFKTTAEVVHNHDAMPALNETLSNMGTDETCPARDQ